MCVCEAQICHITLKPCRTTMLRLIQEVGGDSCPCKKEKNPSGMPTGIRTHDLWRGR